MLIIISSMIEFYISLFSFETPKNITFYAIMLYFNMERTVLLSKNLDTDENNFVNYKR